MVSDFKTAIVPSVERQTFCVSLQNAKPEEERKLIKKKAGKQEAILNQRVSFVNFFMKRAILQTFQRKFTKKALFQREVQLSSLVYGTVKPFLVSFDKESHFKWIEKVNQYIFFSKTAIGFQKIKKSQQFKWYQRQYIVLPPADQPKFTFGSIIFTTSSTTSRLAKVYYQQHSFYHQQHRFYHQQHKFYHQYASTVSSMTIVNHRVAIGIFY